MIDFLVLVFVLFLGGAITIGVCVWIANLIADLQD
jgi:hypothetical protein